MRGRGLDEITDNVTACPLIVFRWRRRRTDANGKALTRPLPSGATALTAVQCDFDEGSGPP